MKKILVTGATGNIGQEVLNFLTEQHADITVNAAVRNIVKARDLFTVSANINLVSFDFVNPATFKEAFNEVDVRFLLRPPHISKVDEVFKPLLLAARNAGINKIVFLSVQGVESSKVIPHNKIEKLIKELNFDYVFLRPSYFMQNLTTTLLPEILKNNTITLSAGEAIFNWIDVKNIGELAANILCNFD